MTHKKGRLEIIRSVPKYLAARAMVWAFLHSFWFAGEPNNHYTFISSECMPILISAFFLHHQIRPYSALPFGEGLYQGSCSSVPNQHSFWIPSFSPVFYQFGYYVVEAPLFSIWSHELAFDFPKLHVSVFCDGYSRHSGHNCYIKHNNKYLCFTCV